MVVVNRGLWGALLLVLLAAPAGAQQGVDRRASMLFVPELLGAATFDVALEGRFDGLIDDARLALPHNAIGLHAGYLHYLDGHGRLGLGGYLGGGMSLEEDGAPQLVRLDVGVSARLRGINRDFFHWSLAAFFEVSPLFLEDAPADADDTRGLRWAAGLETGPGLLFHLDPYVFGETTARIGVESTHLGGRQVLALFASMRLLFDLALRKGAP